MSGPTPSSCLEHRTLSMIWQRMNVQLTFGKSWCETAFHDAQAYPYISYWATTKQQEIVKLETLFVSEFY